MIAQTLGCLLIVVALVSAAWKYLTNLPAKKESLSLVGSWRADAFQKIDSLIAVFDREKIDASGLRAAGRLLYAEPEASEVSQ